MCVSVAAKREAGSHVSFRKQVLSFWEVGDWWPQANQGACPCGDIGLFFLAYLTFVVTHQDTPHGASEEGRCDSDVCRSVTSECTDRAWAGKQMVHLGFDIFMNSPSKTPQTDV